VNALRLTWYRFRTTFRRRLGGYVALALLTGLVGGGAMASITAADAAFLRQIGGLPGVKRSQNAVYFIPVVSIAATAAAALVVANLVAAVPGWAAARARAALALRSE
jgi:hypothetical protein